MIISRNAQRAASLALALALAFLGAFPALAESADAAAPGASEEDLFGSEEVVQAAAPESKPQSGFLKYDQVKLGGSISGSAGGSWTWYDPWGGSARIAEPDKASFSPSLSGKLTLVAKPAEDFGVNADLRFSYPFSTTLTTGEGASAASYSIPNLQVRSFYSKFSWNDAVFMSFGKQPIAWGVARGYFQPADDIFATDAVNLLDTGAEREGPLAFKAMYSIPRTLSNFYIYAGLPSSDSPAFEDLRYAAKAEFAFGNTELALGGFYGYNDHPRGLLLFTTGTGDFNFFGEGVVKYGSERTFLEARGSSDPLYSLLPFVAKTYDDRFFASATIGGYYTNSDANVTVSAQYYYNGEGQAEATAKDAFTMYGIQAGVDANPLIPDGPKTAIKGETQFAMDRMAFGVHNAQLMVSKSKLFIDELSASVIAIADLSDLSGMVIPSLTWAPFDYMSIQLRGSFTFGESSDYYIVVSQKTTPGATVGLTVSLGSGSF